MSAAWLTNIDAVDAVSAVAAVVSGVLLCCWYYLLPRSKLASIPLVNGRRGLDLLHTRAKQRFVADAVGLMRSGFATVRCLLVLRLIPECVLTRPHCRLCVLFYASMLWIH